MVDGRNDYIYYTNSNYFDYVCSPVEDFIDPRLIAKGLSQDKSFEPYLTPGFEQYVNRLSVTEGDVIPEICDLVVTAKTYSPLAVGSTVRGGGDDGYRITDPAKVTFLLQSAEL